MNKELIQAAAATAEWNDEMSSREWKPERGANNIHEMETKEMKQTKDRTRIEMESMTIIKQADEERLRSLRIFMSGFVGAPDPVLEARRKCSR